MAGGVLMSLSAHFRTAAAAIGVSMACAGPALAQNAADAPLAHARGHAAPAQSAAQQTQAAQSHADREAALEAQVAALQEQLTAIQAQLQDLKASEAADAADVRRVQ